MKSLVDIWLRRLVNAWSVVLFFGIVVDLIYLNAYDSVLGIISDIYVSVLTIYGGNKEFARWNNQHKNGHKGEVLIFFWTTLMLILIIFDLLRDDYKMPKVVITDYIAFITILVITYRSKMAHKSKTEKEDPA